MNKEIQNRDKRDHKRPRLVASDIGGTLIRGGGMIPDFTARVLDTLAESGVPVALITGFNRKTTMKYTRNLGDAVMRLPQNGNMCFKGDRTIWEYGIGEQAAQGIYRFLEENDLPIVIYTGHDGEFRNFFKAPPEFQLSDAFDRIDTLTDFKNITGISTLVPNTIAPTIKEKLAAMVGDTFQLIYVRESENSWLEVLQADVRKDFALKRLCGELAIDVADVIYFGDNFNDLEALRLVGHPVVVANAVPELRAEFKTVAPSVTEEGVAHFLMKLYQLKV